MNDDNYSIFGNTHTMVVMIVALVVVLVVMNATRPVQQSAPGYNGNTWQTEIHIEDNDTNVCVGFCPDH